MQPGSSNLSINLGKNRADTATGLFYKWVITTGKIIIVVVELITLGALGYRFFVDRQIVDLNDQIKRAQLFVEAQSKKENLYRSLQDKLTQINTIAEKTQIKVGFLEELTQSLNSSEFITTSLNISESTISIEGEAYSIFALNTLIDSLKENPDVSSISVDELTSVEQGIRFKLTTRIKS